MGCFGKSLAGAGYVVLNIIRVLNIISLLAVIAASSVMLVKIIGVSRFFFFDGCQHVTSIVISGFLVLTELPLFKQHFTNNWPLFSPKSGFVMLGTSMVLVGNADLANLNKTATSPENIGLWAWRLVLGAGIVVIVMGVVNLFTSYIFRDTKIGLTARQVRSHGAVASHKVDVESSVGSSPEKDRSHRRRTFFTGRRDTLPSYYSRSTVAKSEATSSPRTRLNISSPINNDKEQFSRFADAPTHEQLQQPNLAHHPAMTGGHPI